MTGPIALADPAAQDPDVAGHKAARLAHAVAAGLPVLPGRVLPIQASATAIAAGRDALERSGPPAAYLAATHAGPVAGFEDAFASLAGGEDAVVVRSSTGLDDDGRWSGAFASYLDVVPSDVPAAVRGCWASVFSRDVLGRCRETGTEAGLLRVGVLVQPFVRFDAGGTARPADAGRVVVTVAPGGPDGVVGGGRADDVVVDADGRCTGADIAGVSAETLRAVAILSRRTAELGGAGVIEWGVAGDEVLLLQVGPVPAAAAGGPIPPEENVARAIPMRPAHLPAATERLARLVTAFPGILGEELVVSWALGAEETPGAGPLAAGDPSSALAEARALADELIAAVWGRPPSAAREAAASVMRLLREGQVLDGLLAIRDLRAPDPATARRLVGLVAGVGTVLAERGVLPSPALVWRLSGQELDRATKGGRPALRRGPDRWEGFVAEVVAARGRSAMGTPVVAGVAAGRLHPLPALRAIGRPGAREVLAAPLPLPQLAPLLWQCSGLVTAGGSTGAHLFEVARSLGVPAVVGVDATALGGDGSLVSVDGATGRVCVLPADAAVVVEDTPREATDGSRATG